MPVTRAQAAQQEGDEVGNDEGSQHHDQAVCMPFEMQLLSVVQEQCELVRDTNKNRKSEFMGELMW
jgi:hypothetical protein